MKTRYGWEKLAVVLAEPNAADMIRSYHEELSPLKGLYPLDPDWGRLARMEAEGTYRLWVARIDGTLAGFISFFIMSHHNYKTVLSALDGGFYLSPAYRDAPGMIGLNMWKKAEVALQELGVKFIMAHHGQRSLLPFFLHLGYNPRSVLYWKVLGDDQVGPVS